MANWFRRKPKTTHRVGGEAVVTEGEVAERAMDEWRPLEPNDILLAAMDYIADMLSDKKLVPSYLRTEMGVARRLPAVAWEMARKPSSECLFELSGLRGVALEHARQVSKAVLKAQRG